MTINGVQYRESLKTTDWRKARQLARDRIKQLESLDVKTAVEKYAHERRAQVSPRMVKYWKEHIPALSGFFETTKLRSITPAHISEYQAKRVEAGRAPKTINGEVATLRQVLKHARLWYRFTEDYKPIPNTAPPVGKALTEDEQARLFEVSQSRSDWMIAHTAATLAFYCGMRAC